MGREEGNTMSSQKELDKAIEVTQETFNRLFSKPKLTIKLLSKPPFRFIHDIVKVVRTSTGFPKNYFTKAELAPIKEKADKISFLDRLIRLTQACIDERFGHDRSPNRGSRRSAVTSPPSFDGIRSSKIVAGLEPIKTNYLLISLGIIAVDDTTDWSGVIRKLRQGSNAEENGQKERNYERLNSDDTERPDSNLAALSEVGRETKEHQSHNELSHNLKARSPIAADAKRKETRKEQLITVSQEEFQVLFRQCTGNIKQTMDAIGAVISRPKCTEKILNKPPFRFIHDLVMAIDKETGMGLENIFSQQEMVSSNIKGKEGKVAFLSKLVSHVENSFGKSIDIKVSKVIAGLDTEKTRRFLHLFILAATTTTKTKDEMSRNPPDMSNASNARSENRIASEEHDETNHEAIDPRNTLVEKNIRYADEIETKNGAKMDIRKEKERMHSVASEPKPEPHSSIVDEETHIEGVENTIEAKDVFIDSDLPRDSDNMIQDATASSYKNALNSSSDLDPFEQIESAHPGTRQKVIRPSTARSKRQIREPKDVNAVKKPDDPVRFHLNIREAKANKSLPITTVPYNCKDITCSIQTLARTASSIVKSLETQIDFHRGSIGI